MQHFAALTLTELAPILTILAGMLIGFYGLLKFILVQSDKTSTADREERQAFMQTLDNLAKATDRNVEAHREVANAVTKQALEAAERNGHLAELQLQSQETMKLIADQATSKIITAVQNVDQQNVEHQIVKNKE